MAVNFNGTNCCPPAQKKQPKAAQFGQNFSQRPGGKPGQVQFGIVDGGVVSGPCSCIACCCAPFVAIPAAILALFLGKKAFRGLGSLGGSLKRGVSGLGERASSAVKRKGKEVAESA